MKYLYPYECEKEKLSTSDELQQAIDGNRREGKTKISLFILNLKVHFIINEILKL